MAGGEPQAPEPARLDFGAIRARADTARATAEAHPPGSDLDLRGSAEHVLATGDVQALLAEVQRLYGENARLRNPFNWTVTWHLGTGEAVDLGGHGNLVGLDGGDGQVLLSHPDVPAGEGVGHRPEVRAGAKSGGRPGARRG